MRISLWSSTCYALVYSIYYEEIISLGVREVEILHNQTQAKHPLVSKRSSR